MKIITALLLTTAVSANAQDIDDAALMAYIRAEMRTSQPQQQQYQQQQIQQQWQEMDNDAAIRATTTKPIYYVPKVRVANQAVNIANGSQDVGE